MKADYAAFADVAEFRAYLGKVPVKQPLAVWLNLELGERESEGFGTRIASIEVSSKAGEGRSVWLDEKGEALKALAPVLVDPKRAKIVHDPKLFQLLAGRAANLKHATQLYSYLLRPTTANHNLADVVMRQWNVVLGGGPGERADYLQRLAPVLRTQIDEQELADVYEKIDLPLAPVLADMERIGIRVDPKELDKMSMSMEREVRRLEKEIWKLAGNEFNINSPAQLAEILFDKLNLQPPARRGKGKVRSTAADILEEMAAQHELPAKIIEYREISKLKSTYVDALPKLIHPQTGRLHTSFSQTTAATGRLSSSDPNLQNIPDSHGVRERNSRGVCRGERQNSAFGGLLADRTARHGAFFLRSGPGRCLPQRRRYSRAHRAGSLWRWTDGAKCGASPRSESDQFRNYLWTLGLRLVATAWHRAEGSRAIYQRVFHPLPGSERIPGQVLVETRKTGVAKTLFGRVRPIPEINSPQAQLRSFAERTALNSPLQGTAADLIKLAMIKIDRAPG